MKNNQKALVNKEQQNLQKKKFTVKDLMDEAFFLFPPFGILKQMKACLITGVQRESHSEVDAETGRKENRQRIVIELDGYADFVIEAINGKVLVNIVPNGSSKMTTIEKVEFLIKADEEKEKENDRA